MAVSTQLKHIICVKFLDWSYFKHFRYRQALVHSWEKDFIVFYCLCQMTQIGVTLNVPTNMF